jgi:SAM-dependent methyltransferase
MEETMRLPNLLLLSIASSVMCLAIYPLWSNAQKVSDEFSQIYKEGRWGKNSAGEGTSGVGSVYANAVPYMQMLQDFLQKNHIQSVVDLGCGDWELFKHIPWGDIKYYGYDVVPEIIQKNKKHETKNIHFYCEDAIHTELPKADLLICKDVLEHLPNSFIEDFLKKTKDFKYCLITNDVTYGTTQGWIPNKDIMIGQLRWVELAKKPFYAQGKTLLVYKTPYTTKEVFLISR